MVKDPDAYSMEATNREMTVMFCDMRGFTKLSEHMEPIQLQALLNDVFTRLTGIIRANRGTIDKYMGDCVMAFWGAPLDDRHHALKAVRAAVEVQRRIHDLNERRRMENESIEQENRTRMADGQPPLPPHALLTLGTGINTGLMTAGFMGSEAHLSNYTVFGREVNLAARLESLSGSSRILISQATLDAVSADDPALAASARGIGAHPMKGIQQPVPVYEVSWQETRKNNNEAQAGAL